MHLGGLRFQAKSLKNTLKNGESDDDMLPLHMCLLISALDLQVCFAQMIERTSANIHLARSSLEAIR